MTNKALYLLRKIKSSRLALITVAQEVLLLNTKVYYTIKQR